ncbi:MAG: hypothetical protein KBD01_04900 [Acidobacteria bacterium]|nr:hypothetical protein [Acidobacteriota bacterium]
MSAARKDLALAGMMGAGKTVVGQALSRFLGRPFVDLDELIVQHEKKSIPELFAKGEAVFRHAERAAVLRWLERPPKAAPEVLALGGGTLENGEVAEAIARRAVLVHLDAPADVLFARLHRDEVAARPLLAGAPDPARRLAELREKRAAGYARADIAVPSDRYDAEGTAVAVLRVLYQPGRGPWRETARPLAPRLAVAQGIVIGRGALELPEARCAALLLDSGIPDVHKDLLLPLLRERAGGRLGELERPGGEDAKSVESLAEAWAELLIAGADKDTPLWVMGGGTLTDLGGLVAHTYKRGLPLQLAPTTLLAQLDAALGGKNGINFAGSKNVVGTIRLPEGVNIDPLFLLTLRDDDLREGLTEAVKASLVGDPELLDHIESSGPALRERSLPALEDLVARAALTKLEVVERDLEEAGQRRVLNLGHTLGHALEAATRERERPLPHGESVAIGMVFALRLARRAGVLEDLSLLERVPAALEGLGIATRWPGLSPREREFFEIALGRDKKRSGGETVWVLPQAAGRVVWRTLPTEDVEAALRDFA